MYYHVIFIKGQQLFASLFDTLGKTPVMNKFLYVGAIKLLEEVLFFMPQRVSAQREKNWVSFRPCRRLEARSL